MYDEFARLTDFELGNELYSAICDRRGYDLIRSGASFEESVIYCVIATHEDVVNRKVHLLVSQGDLVDLHLVSETYYAIGLPRSGAIFAILAERVDETGLAGDLDRDQVVSVIGETPLGSFDDLDRELQEEQAQYDVTEHLARYVRSRLDKYAHLAVKAHRRGDLVNEDPAFLGTFGTLASSYGLRHDRVLPGRDYFFKEKWTKDWVKRDDYAFMNVGKRNTGLGEKDGDFDEPQPYIRYLKPIGGVYFELRTDLGIHVQDR